MTWQPNEAWERADALLNKAFQPPVYNLRNVKSDGSCLYYSLLGPEATQETVLGLRQKISKAMRDHIANSPEGIVLKESLKEAMREAAQTPQGQQGYSPALKAVFSDPPAELDRFIESEDKNEGWQRYLTEMESCLTMFGGILEIKFAVQVLKKRIYVYQGGLIEWASEDKVLALRPHMFPDLGEDPTAKDYPIVHLAHFQSKAHFDEIIIRDPSQAWPLLAEQSKQVACSSPSQSPAPQGDRSSPLPLSSGK